METLDILNALCAIPTVSGFESLAAGELDGIALPLFDEAIHTPVGNHIYIKHCGIQNAKKLLLDAHFDEIGFLVRDIMPKSGKPEDKDCEGFLGFVTSGGIDSRIISSAEVTVWGKRAIPGVISSTPPHLQKKGDMNKLPEPGALCIDTGLSVAELEELAPVGTQITFSPGITELLNGRVAGKAFDDKACAAVILAVADKLSGRELPCDVYAVFSAAEETSGMGAVTAAFGIEPDYAIALDVDFADSPDTPKHKSIKMGEGPSVSISTSVDRMFTEKLAAFAKENELKLQRVVETAYTGTNGDYIPLTGAGVSVAVVSIPLRNMHTCAEVIELADIESAAELIARFICEGGMT